MFRRASARLLAAIIMGASFLVPTSPPASALGAQSDSFDLSWSATIPSLGTCVYFRLTGKVTYTTVQQSIFWSGATHTQYVISQPTVSKPILVVTYKNYSSYSGCYSAGTADGLTVKQHWTGYSCNLNPSFSVGVPFSVGVGFWPTCSNRNQATFKSTYSSANMKSFTQSRDTSYVRFNTVSELDAKPTAPCYGAFVNGALVQNISGDATEKTFSTSAKKVCLTPSW